MFKKTIKVAKKEPKEVIDTGPMPGDWPSTTYSVLSFQDAINEWLFFVIPKLWEAKERLSAITAFLLIIFGLSGILFALYQWFYILTFFVFFRTFGLFGFWTFGFSMLTLVLSILTGCVSAVSYYWIDLCYVFSFFFASIGQAQADAMYHHAKSMHRSLGLDIKAGLRLKPKDITIDDVTYTFDNVVQNLEHNPALLFSIISKWTVCPNPVLSVIQILLLLILLGIQLFRASFSKFLKLFHTTYKIVGWSMGFILLLVYSDVSTVSSMGSVLWFVIGSFVSSIISLLTSKGFVESKAILRLTMYIIILKVTRSLQHVQLIMQRHRGGKKSFARSKTTFATFWNNSMMSLQRTIDDIALPEFIRSLPSRFDRDGLNESRAILESLGWPKTAEDADPDFSKYTNAPSGWVISGSVFKTGIRQLRMQMDYELTELAKLAPAYVRSEQYQSYENELKSLSRYFADPDYAYPTLGLDDVWSVVGDIFRDSKLTPFQWIIKKWEKKYGLGPLWMDPDAKRPRKLSRRKAIKMLGGIPEFVKLWAKTFRQATSIVPVAGVSVKGEALPPRKFLADVVRTIVSSPLSHYISSTVWNFAPNHNYKWRTSPIKIGMPLNGANLSKLWSEHSTFDFHFAGDMTAFDSTVAGRVQEMIRRVRKQGFVHHKDYSKICFLIDANYDNLKSMPLMTTSTGNVWKKGSGLSTGHSSTSMDNSLACVIIYLMLWKDLTGFSAHEFKYFNKLSNYGDDHILSRLRTAPTSWAPDNIIKRALKFGIVMRDEEPSGRLDKMAFLSKKACRPTAKDFGMFKKLGLDTPAWLIYHDKDKLIGKMTAPVRSMDRDYRVKRLISYLYLCSHHEDVYAETRLAITRILDGKPSKWFVPTYEDVLKKWYDPKSSFHVDLDKQEHVVEEAHKDSDVFMDYTANEFMEILASVMSVIPDILNPAIFNAGYVDWFVSRFGSTVTWPLELLRRSNQVSSLSHLSALTKRTPYAFLSDNFHVQNNRTNDSYGKLLVCHWVFLAFRSRKRNPTSITSIVNTLSTKMSSVQFFVNGRVTEYTSRVGLPIWDMLLIAALSFIPDIPALDFLWLVQLPNPSLILDQIIGMGVNQLWSRVPTNFRQLRTLVEHVIEDNSQGLIVAPTGTGKSTTMIKHIYDQVQDRFEKVIVVVPRSLLAHTIPPYFTSSFGIRAIGLTAGLPYDPSARVVYCTVAEIFLHEELLVSNNFWVIDECHVDEAAHRFIKHTLRSLKRPTVLTSATPERKDRETSSMTIDLPIARVWEITDNPVQVFNPDPDSYGEYWAQYRAWILDTLKAAHPATKFLVFVVDKGHAAWLADRLPRRVGILSSDNKEVDDDVTIIIATSVADVGVTLPNVDWVITSNVTRMVETDAMYSARTSLVCINEGGIKQRKGRGGRTSNSLFSLFMVPHTCSWISTANAETHIADAVSLISSGIPMSWVGKMRPDIITNITGLGDYDRSHDEYIDRYIATAMAFTDEVNEGVGTMKLKAAPDSGDVGGVPFITHANELFSSIEKDGQQQPLTTNQWVEFLIKSAKVAADREFVVTRDNAMLYLRTQPVNGKSFVYALTDGFVKAKKKFSGGGSFFSVAGQSADVCYGPRPENIWKQNKWNRILNGEQFFELPD